MKYEDMKVCNHAYNFNESDLILASDNATFTHKEACEYIFYIGSVEAIEDLYSKNFSNTFLLHCTSAKSTVYKYICFYE